LAAIPKILNFLVCHRGIKKLKLAHNLSFATTKKPEAIRTSGFKARKIYLLLLTGN